MKNYVIINGVNSNTITGLMINELPPITKPQMRVQNEEIDGRDGDITTNLGYSAYDKTITVGLFGTGYDINDIVAFFNGEGTIVFSNEADKYYNFKILNQIDYVALQKFKSASITFHCQPFKYPLTETPLEIEYEYIEDEGESLTLNNTGEATLKLDLLGNTSQTGTPTPTSPIPVNVVSGDNEVVINGKNLCFDTTKPSNANLKFFINKPSQTFTISFTTNEALNNNSVYLEVDGVSKGNIGGITASANTRAEKTYTLSNENYQAIQNGTNIDLLLYKNNANFTIPTDSMIENGSSASTYEPYQSSTYPINLPVENLLGLTDGTYSDVGITAVVNNGEITLNGTATANSFVVIDLLQSVSIGGTNHIVSLNNATAVNDSNTEVRLIDGGNYDNIKLNVANNTRTLNISRTYTKLQIRTSSGVSYNNYVIKPQLEKGSKANHYTPYGTTPIELCKIGTYQDKFIRNSGKNLSIKNIKGFFNAGDTKIAVDGDSESFVFEAVAGKTYTFSCQTTTNRKVIAQVDTLDIVNNTPIYNSVAINSNTFTPTFSGYCLIYVNSTLNNAIKETFMINEGSTPLPYEPYGTGQWCKYNAIGKKVFDGSETWLENTPRFALELSGYASGTYQVYSNKFTYVNSWQTHTSTNNSTILYKDSAWQVARLSFNYNGVANVNEWKTWLSSNNVIAYYPLATPYLSLIEDTTLISQLDNIQNAMSYEGTTNISQVNDDKAFIISAKALEQGSNEVVVSNIGNAYSKPLIALEGSGNVDIYLDNTQILQANVEDKMNIDIAKLEAYNPDTSALLNRQVIGNYNTMTLQPGNNTIRIDGALDKATISNYTRWL